jgi:hypothetical protein
MTDDDKRRQDEADAHERERPVPPAGPHADPRLTNEDATPGAGSLPDRTDGEADPASG